MNNVIQGIGDLLFWIAGGYPVSHSWLFIPYVTVAVILIAITIHVIKQNVVFKPYMNNRRFWFITSVISFGVILTATVYTTSAIVFTQLDQVEKCNESIETVELVGIPHTLRVKHCIARENYNINNEWDDPFIKLVTSTSVND